MIRHGWCISHRAILWRSKRQCGGCCARTAWSSDRSGAATPLPTLSVKLATWLDEIRTGRGFVVVRGLNVADYTDDEVGTHLLGARRLSWRSRDAESSAATCSGHVYDHGRRYGDIDVRGYETEAAHPRFPLRWMRSGRSAVSAACQERRAEQHRQLGHATQRDHRQHQMLPPLYQGYHYIKREAALTKLSGDREFLGAGSSVPRMATSVHWLVRNQINAQPASRLSEPLEPLERWRRWISSTAWLDDPAVHLDMDSTARRRTAALQQPGQCFVICAPASRTGRSRSDDAT